MNILLSSGLKWRWMENYGLRAMLYGGWIGLYENPKPTNPDFAPTSRLLARVTQDGLPHTPGSMAGGALRMQQVSIGILRASPTPSNWILTGIANGRATWFRYYSNTTDSNENDFAGDYVRLDGGVATEIDGGEALVLANPVIAIGDSRPVTDFILTFTI